MIMVSICLLCNYIDVDIVQKYTDKSLALGHFYQKNLQDEKRENIFRRKVLQRLRGDKETEMPPTAE